eukprot:CAMPEP_0171122066 /NCGR_PEP_ID=MMETSP0766_2-20121228/104177_1 /TAXON_ID=439317 /ORGANISM="Gambierdiscus australes, Strain CAWD 149" /LENGTH=122 /DNA_ID=CAMNT_0011584881 /DNA_START=556 /DNA_END=924 /DNA_ORIENTATION=+
MKPLKDLCQVVDLAVAGLAALAVHFGTVVPERCGWSASNATSRPLCPIKDVVRDAVLRGHARAWELKTVELGGDLEGSVPVLLLGEYFADLTNHVVHLQLARQPLHPTEHGSLHLQLVQVWR